MRSVAIIGSFRKYYSLVLDAHRTFAAAGWTITSPLGTPTIGAGDEEFVRFASDRIDWSDEMIETVALHRILCAHATYVIAPAGYVGRTTAYEIGRIVQVGGKLAFSEAPLDLPLGVTERNVMTPEQFVERLTCDAIPPLHDTFPEERRALEQALIRREYREI